MGFYLLQWLWGLPQNILGGILLLILHRMPRFRFRKAIVTRWSRKGSMSLGMFLFLGETSSSAFSAEQRRIMEQHVLVHEYGHSIQSLILGPLYLPVIGLPSILWANFPVLIRLRRQKNISYYRMYQESWANRLGERVTHLSAPR